MTSKRVFLLDDHEVVREGIRAVLDAEPDLEVVGEWDVARGAADAILDASPDVAVLDVRLPDGSGIEVLREVRQRDPEIKGLVLTGFQDDTALFAAVVAGASGFVQKQIAIDTLVSSVRLVASGHSMIDPAVVLRLTERNQPVAQESPASPTSPPPSAGCSCSSPRG